MKRFDEYPKSFKKTIRYISQDELTIEQLESMQRMLNHHINKRKKELYNKENNRTRPSALALYLVIMNSSQSMIALRIPPRVGVRALSKLVE